MTSAIRFWPGTRTLLTEAAQANLDLTVAVGQRQSTFRFALTDGVTGENLGDLHPIRDPAVLSHDTASTTKRRLSLSLGTAEVAEIDLIRDRISPFMVFPGVGEYPLGRYMFTAPQTALAAVQQRTGTYELNDEMFLVDQQITTGINGVGDSIPAVLTNILTPLPVSFDIEPSPFLCGQAWGLGSGRGSILDALAITGDYWAPWFDNNGVLRFVRTFDPATQVPDLDLDLDLGARVYRDSIVESNELLTAPNVFIVVSNGGVDSTDSSSDVGEIVGRAEVPPQAPHSVANRGFEIVQQVNTQLTSTAQAQAVAQGLAQRQAVFETTTLSTAPDPRHDGYNVIRWDGANWLELAWSMEMVDGGEMTHVLRKSYAA